jgi:hypothetical protein
MALLNSPVAKKRPQTQQQKVAKKQKEVPWSASNFKNGI